MRFRSCIKKKEKAIILLRKIKNFYNLDDVASEKIRFLISIHAMKNLFLVGQSLICFLQNVENYVEMVE